MRFSLAAFAVVALAQLSEATVIKTNCKKNEFWFPEKSCCLPIGGPPKPAPPPTGVLCPPGWSWEGPKKCCVPNNKPPPKPPVPTCPKGWTWWPVLFKCLPTPKPPVPHPPMPSKPPHQPPKPPHHPPKPPHHPPKPPTIPPKPPHHPPKPPHNPAPPKPPHHGHWRRDETSRIALCPSGLRACPLPGLLAGDYECLDTKVELTSCGGCASEGKGQDCTAIRGAWNVACENSACVVHSCTGGFELSADGKSCVPL